LRPGVFALKPNIQENNMTRELYDLTASELSQAYRSKELSPVEVTRAVLARIDECEPKLNAMYITDTEGALAQAAASEIRWRESRSLSQLDGVPITIKDLIATKGDPVPVGTAAADFTPAAVDHPPVARVKEAGCVILGKTTMPDFGMLGAPARGLQRHIRIETQPGPGPDLPAVSGPRDRPGDSHR
jgi:aspartyl-tRNA(Asn)/glutamyl-tRNA(Gln) amidotransferase subunit A